MRPNDYAILVGISEYSDSNAFATLKSPPNDVARMHEWLLKPNGGGLPQENVKVILTPRESQQGTPPNDWRPTEHHFQSEFRAIVTDDIGQPVRRPEGRLYLYFSGHGFSERRDQNTRAAVFSANATRFFANNICGTVYAFAAKEQALFGEIVLIMDCCRDSEQNLPFSLPPINTGSHDAAAAVRVFAIYAAPKGGKAQERVFKEAGNKVCGLLTHALLKSLGETFPDSAQNISSTALKRYLRGTWTQVCGDEPAPEPDFVLPSGEDIQFPVANEWLPRDFLLSALPTQQLQLEIFNGNQESIAVCTLTPTGATLTRPGQAAADITLNGLRFRLKLQQGFYRYVLSGDTEKSDTFEVPGVVNVSL